MCRWYLAIESLTAHRTYAVDINRARFDCKLFHFVDAFIFARKRRERERMHTQIQR